MKTRFAFLALFVVVHLHGFAQDQFSKLAFIQTKSQNTTMFVQNDFGVKHKDLENGRTQDYFMQKGVENEYELTYNNLEHLESLLIYTTEELYDSFKAECRKTCDAETATGEGVVAIYSNGAFRYIFSTYIGWLDLGYTIEVQRIE